MSYEPRAAVKFIAVSRPLDHLNIQNQRLQDSILPFEARKPVGLSFGARKPFEALAKNG